MFPEYKSALESSLGEGALSTFEELAKKNMDQMNFFASAIYKNFIKLT